jgi:hypothetical protein
VDIENQVSEELLKKQRLRRKPSRRPGHPDKKHRDFSQRQIVTALFNKIIVISPFSMRWRFLSITALRDKAL